MKMTTRLLALFSIFALSLTTTQVSHAIVEIRGGYSMLNTSKDTSTGVEPKTMGGFHADAIIDPPLFPIGFGLRYENLSSSQNSVDYTFNRLAAIINYRIIDTLVFAGLIGTVGLSNSFKVKSSSGTTTLDSGTTYSIGAEAGVNLMPFLVGAEIGYNMGELKKDSSKYKTDGAYAKVHVGIGF